jgi:RNA polymerase sigma-70 factor (ECF subfamily)
MAGADEERLLERLRRREEAAFNELVRAHQGQVYRLLLRMLGDPAEAEDVTQEVFVNVFKALDRFRGDSALATWIHRIAANLGKNRLKYLARRARDAQRPLDEARHGHASTEALAPPDQQLEGRRTEQRVRDALAALDDDHRVLVVLRDLEHMSYEEIQEVTGLPIGTVKSRLHRARLSLQRAFAAGREET